MDSMAQRLLLCLAIAACSAPSPPMTDKNPNTFARYMALGDSMSIDLYPAQDVAFRYPGQASTDELGAASLLIRNDDKFWPEFKGRDLTTRMPGIALADFTADGATTESLLRQVERIDRSDEATLVTITAGGNDLLGAIGAGRNPADDIFGRLRKAIDRVFELRPHSLVIVATVYDPTDGTNKMPGFARKLDREAEWLRDFNDRVRGLAQSDTRIRVADIHRHFLGHGLSIPVEKQWYLRESIIEPNAPGANEIRRLWVEILGL